MQGLNKKLIGVMLVAALLVSAMLVGCGPEEPEPQNGEGQESKYKAVLLLAGNLGDMSFLDSANRGMQMIKEELGWEIKVIEMGTDPSNWEPTSQTYQARIGTSSSPERSTCKRKLRR